MSIQLERYEKQLEEELASGAISQIEFNREMRDLQRDYADAARESAEDAYRNEFDRW